jgi:hypothetical protein
MAELDEQIKGLARICLDHAQTRSDRERRSGHGCGKLAAGGSPSRWFPAGGDARLRRPLVLSGFGAAAAGTVAAVVLGTTSGVSPAPAEAVAFRTAASGDIIATVADPFAARAQLDAAFAKQGLKICYTLQTDDCDLLYVQSRGVRHGSAEVLARLGHGEDVDASEYTFRTSTQIETAAPSSTG